MHQNRKKAYIYLLFTAVLWGFAGVVIKLTLEGIDPLPFLTYRFFLASLIALPYLIKFKSLLLKRPKAALSIVIFSLLSTTFALGFLFLGMDKTTLLNTAMITLAGPLLVEAAGVIFLNERLTKREKLGTGIAFAGTLLTILEPILNSGGGFGHLEGNVFIMAYLVVDIISIIILKKLLRKSLPPDLITNVSFGVGFVSLLPIVIFTIGLSSMITTVATLPFNYHLGVWYMAFVSGSLAYYLRAKGQKTIEIGEGALFAYLVPIIQTISALFILRETITPLFVMGAFVVIMGVWVAETKAYARKR